RLVNRQFGTVAQLVEQRPFKPLVPGSSPGRPTKFMDPQQTAPRLSAIVCTCNNARSLEGTLESLTHQELPPGVGYEVLIVDNNSTDDTAAVAQRFASPDSRFRYVFE